MADDTYNARAHTCKRCRPFTMRRDFEGGVYRDELAETCGDILRAAGFRGAARFRGNTVPLVLSRCLNTSVFSIIVLLVFLLVRLENLV